MANCWQEDPQARPSFEDLHAQLTHLINTNMDDEDDCEEVNINPENQSDETDFPILAGNQHSSA